MARFEKLDLDTLLADKTQHVYVRNNSLRAQLLIVLEMKDRQGRGRALKIPPTDVPISITASFSREILSESQDLRQALTKGNIVLVPATEAEAYLESNAAALEMNSFQMSAYADSAPGNATGDSMARLAKKSKNVSKQADVLEKKTNAGAEISVRVKTIMGSFQSKEKTAKETLGMIMRMKTALNKAELGYIMQNCEGDDNIKKFIMSALAELQATPETPFEK